MEGGGDDTGIGATGELRNGGMDIGVSVTALAASTIQSKWYVAQASMQKKVRQQGWSQGQRQGEDLLVLSLILLQQGEDQEYCAVLQS
jgi:hypothetical protein